MFTQVSQIFFFNVNSFKKATAYIHEKKMILIFKTIYIPSSSAI